MLRRRRTLLRLALLAGVGFAVLLYLHYQATEGAGRMRRPAALRGGVPEPPRLEGRARRDEAPRAIVDRDPDVPPTISLVAPEVCDRSLRIDVFDGETTQVPVIVP